MAHYALKSFYRLHLDEPGKPVFLTWRLQDSLPPNRSFPAAYGTSRRAFALTDRMLVETHTDACYLRQPLAQPRVANMVVEAIRYNAEVVRAGLATDACDHSWSSGRATRGSPAKQGGCPT